MAETAAVFDPDEASILLIGTKEEIEQGLALIDQHLRRRFCAWLRKRFPGLPPHELADAWAATLVNVWETIQTGTFDANQPLIPWLCTIAYARATDCLRRTTTRDKALAAVGEALRHTKTGQRWQALGDMQRREVMEIIRQGITGLPPQQRAVFQVFVNGYPETAKMGVLRQEVSQTTGREETLASVKRALQEARKKVRDLLEKKGYGLDAAE